MKRFTFLIMTLSALVCAQESVLSQNNQSNLPVDVLTSQCAPAMSAAMLDIGKVSTIILGGGNLWWDLGDRHYEVPKGSGKHSVFAGALWIGALDENGLLKVAAETYRQSGVDFWPGPLSNNRLLPSDNSDLYIYNPEYGKTSSDICQMYDKHYTVYRSEVEMFVDYMNSANPAIEFPNYQIPQNILDYPGNRHQYNSENYYQGADNEVETNPYYEMEGLAPYRDVNNDGFYDPLAGDYPEFNIDNSLDCQSDNFLRGDQSIWYVFNDNGGYHQESQSEHNLGLEIHAHAYAFASTGVDAIDYSTFYNYRMINRSHSVLNEMYIGQYIDADVGEYNDDYVGCDVMRGLGYAYNGDDDDEGVAGYGETPPAVGVDFLMGPLADENDGVDNDKDGVIDEDNERISMSHFVYYDNDFTDYGNPSTAEHFYNYLQSKWKDGQPMTYGHLGYTATNPVCNYMFPSDTDPTFPDQTWTEESSWNDPADRRFMQSVGPFTMAPGAVKFMDIGVIWSRAEEGGPMASVERLKLDNDLVQEVFDNCFELACEEENEVEIAYELQEDTYATDMLYGVKFNSTLSGALIENLEVSWDFGDGHTSNHLNPIHYYGIPGDYSVYLTVQSECFNETYFLEVHVPYFMNSNSILSIPITRVEGIGNGGCGLELSAESKVEIRDNFAAKEIHYKRNYGPFLVHITDTNTVADGDYELKVLDESIDNFTWQIKQLETGEIHMFQNQEVLSEAREFEDWGFSVQINQVYDVGDETSVSNGYHSSSMSASNWLSFLQDENDYLQPNEGMSAFNWISDDSPISPLESNQNFDQVLEGTWAPFSVLTIYGNSYFNHYTGSVFQALSSISLTPSVDVVFTNDQSLWTRVAVIETGDFSNRLGIKTNPSVDKSGNVDGTGTGFSWFPGYAIDIERGMRLNMMFGEASHLEEHHGNDMMWNPTSAIDEGDMFIPGSNNPNEDYNVYLGGMHYIYIMNTKYEGDDETLSPHYSDYPLMNVSSVNLRNVLKEIKWVSIPLLKEGATLLSDDVEVKLRVSKPYESYDFTGSGLEDVVYQNDGKPLYRFSIDGDYSDLSIENDFATSDAKLIKVLNVLGQEVLLERLEVGTIYIEVYDDGSSIKKVKR